MAGVTRSVHVHTQILNLFVYVVPIHLCTIAQGFGIHCWFDMHAANATEPTKRVQPKLLPT